jgi:hypothetical protein
MKYFESKVRLTGIILLIQTIAWLICTIISMSQVQASWSNIDYIKWVSKPDIYFMANYVNATLLTFVDVILFSYLFSYLKSKEDGKWLVGMVFIPIYGALNVICYSIQISIVPAMAQASLADNSMLNITQLLIQANPQSLVGYINGMAYAVLGIPSIIFGLGLYKNGKKLSAAMLIVSGLSSIVGIIGYSLNSDLLTKGTMVGGVFFLFSLIFITVEFGSTKENKEVLLATG